MKNLGKKATDKVTGFKGIITSKISYLTGCDQYGITPAAKDNKTESTEYFDISRVIVAAVATKRTSNKTGGPNRDAPR